MTPSAASRERVRSARRGAGFLRESPFGVVAVSGPDAVDFLDRQLPAPIARTADGRGGVTARLDCDNRSFAIIEAAVED